MNDPIAEFIRAERETLLGSAPAPHAARLWHEARRRRAASLRRAASAAGWLIRLIVAAAALMSLVPLRPGSYFLILLLAVTIWLTHGACAPLRLFFQKGMRP